MGHPCLTPRPITPGSESPPTVRTTASCLMYRSCNNLLSLQSMCNFFIISNILPQLTLSNAFSKSTKQIYSLFPHSKLLLHSVLITPTASLVPQPFLNGINLGSGKVVEQEMFCFPPYSLCQHF